MPKGARHVLLNQAFDRRAGCGMDLGGLAMLQPIEGSRRPGVVALETDFPGADRPWRSRRFNRNRLESTLDTIPEALFGGEKLDLIEPVGGDLEDLILVV